MITFLQKLAEVWAQNANIFAIFWRKYFKNHNIGPRLDLDWFKSMSHLKLFLGNENFILFCFFQDLIFKNTGLMKDVIRWTRLGRIFAHWVIGDCSLWAFFQMTQEAQNGRLLYHWNIYVLNLTKCRLGQILGDLSEKHLVALVGLAIQRDRKERKSFFWQFSHFC
jgi:hypothetical protein